MTDKKSISDLGAKGAERRRLKKIKQEKQRSEEARRTEKHQNALLKSALKPRWYLYFSVITMVALPAVSGLASGLLFPQDKSVLFGSIGSGLGLSILVVAITHFLLKQRSQRWLDRIPYSWNPSEYFDLLSKEYGFSVRLIIRITLDSRVPPDWQQTVTDAVNVLVKNTRLEWKNEKLVEVLSPEINASEYVKGQQTYYNNHIHSWFKNFVDNAVPVLHREFPLKRLDVRIK